MTEIIDYRQLRKEGLTLSDVSAVVMEDIISGRIALGGADEDRTISYIALSWRETGAEWITVRPGMSLTPPCNMRTAVGIEFESPGGGVLTLRDSVLDDADAQQWLLDNGLAFPQNGKLSPMGGLGQPNGDKQAEFFEWIIAERKGNLLDQISFGPTQMWLKYCAMFDTASDLAKRCGWLHTWEELWTWYTCATASEIYELLAYQDPPCNNNPYPSTPGDPKSLSVAWLTNHVGNAQGAAAYYDGVGVDPSVAFSNSLFQVRKLADMRPESDWHHNP